MADYMQWISAMFLKKVQFRNLCLHLGKCSSAGAADGFGKRLSIFQLLGKVKKLLRK